MGRIAIVISVIKGCCSSSGSAVQQAVSGLTRLRPDIFQGSGANFIPMGASSFRYSSPCLLTLTIGFEYWSNPSNPDEGYVSWMVDGKQTTRLGATAVGPDQGVGGSGVGRRLIPEEPMVRLCAHRFLISILTLLHAVNRVQSGDITELADYRLVDNAVPCIVSD